jgi:hypothetical protein
MSALGHSQNERMDNMYDFVVWCVGVAVLAIPTGVGIVALGDDFWHRMPDTVAGGVGIGLGGLCLVGGFGIWAWWTAKHPY